jgi:hypothetical protein
MSAYYSFHHPKFSPAEMDPNKRLPDAKFAPSLAQQMHDSLNVQPVNYIPCCTKPEPCQTWIQYKPEYSGCAPTWVSWADATGGKIHNVEIGEKDSRIWVANLSPLHYWRAVTTGAEWTAESTEPHIRNRQLFANYLQSSLYPTSRPYEKRIDNPSESYVALRQRYGPNFAQYTTF